MTQLTVHIKNEKQEKKVKDFLDSIGLDYSETKNWWDDDAIVNELEKRSQDLKSGKDKGFTFDEIKTQIANK
jgi:hypothetical protein